MRFLATVITGLAAGLVILSTMYLGVHWLTDVTTGVFLGVMAAMFAARELRPPLSISATEA